MDSPCRVRQNTACVEECIPSWNVHSSPSFLNLYNILTTLKRKGIFPLVQWKILNTIATP